MSLLKFLLFGIVGGTVSMVVEWYINKENIKENIRQEYTDAFKVLIKEKKQNAVKVGIFNNEEDLIEDVKIQSEQGVSSSIHEGDVIYV